MKFTPAEIGRFSDPTYEAYSARDAVSNSLLTQMARSPAHALAWMQGRLPDEKTAAFSLGTLCHAGALEQASVESRFAVMPAFESDRANVTADGRSSTSKATSYYKRAAADFAYANAGKAIVSAEEFAAMNGVVKSLLADKLSASLLGGVGSNEVTLVWNSALTGLRCKARLDRLVGGFVSRLAIVDLKTTRNAAGFEREIANYGYHRQMAWYAKGVANVLDVEFEDVDCYLIAVEPFEPFCVRVAKLSDDAMRIGKFAVAKDVQSLAYCLEKDEWPGYGSPLEWQLPQWMLDRDDTPQKWSSK